ncbi:MAG: hypothetical protein M5U26_16485 [Planctomycetota bacterium]|nr:hypothetical protein [Planctomycetota bacterium]
MTRLRVRRACLLSAPLALLLAACGQGSPKTQPPMPAEVPPAGPVTSGTALGDRSLAPEAYAEAGLPPLDRPWTGADMDKAQQVLRDLAAKDDQQLPRIESPRSQAVFKRMVSDENLAPFRDANVALDQRLPGVSDFMLKFNGLLMLYYGPLSQQRGYQREILELLAYVLKVANQASSVVDEFLPSLDKNDPTYLARMAGFNRMKAGMTQILDGAVTTLTETNVYSKPDLARYARQIKESLPRLAPSIGPEVAQSLPGRIQRIAEAEADPDYKAALEALRSACEPAPAK